MIYEFDTRIGEHNELNLVVNRELSKEEIYLSNPLEVYNFMINQFEVNRLTEEKMYLLCASTKSLIGVFQINHGTINHFNIRFADIFKKAMLVNSFQVILVHNHPSGNPRPSREDFKITESIMDMGRKLGISVLDHIVIGRNNYVSIKKEGDL